MAEPQQDNDTMSFSFELLNDETKALLFVGLQIVSILRQINFTLGDISLHIQEFDDESVESEELPVNDQQNT